MCRQVADEWQRHTLKGVAKTPCTSLKLKSRELLLKIMQEFRCVFLVVLSLLYVDVKYVT